MPLTNTGENYHKYSMLTNINEKKITAGKVHVIVNESKTLNYALAKVKWINYFLFNGSA